MRSAEGGWRNRETKKNKSENTVEGRDGRTAVRIDGEDGNLLTAQGLRANALYERALPLGFASVIHNLLVRK